MDQLVRKVLDGIEQRRLLSRGESLLVALSGGADSVALLLVLHELSGLMGLNLAAAHVNHGLRGADSDGDERFCERLCRDLQVPLEVERLEAGGLQGRRGNLEARARRLRYRFLDHRAAAERRVIVTGHTMNDQSETLLMRLIRGAGPNGLSGIPVLREIPAPPGTAAGTCVTRPLLEVTREEVLEYLERRGQGYREDSSNRDPGFDRNWIRNELIPLLEMRLNPRLVQTLSRTAGLFREMEEILLEKEREVFRFCRVGSPTEVVLDVERLGTFPVFARRLAVRSAIGQVSGHLFNIEYDHIEAVLNLMRGSSGHEVHLPSRLRVVLEYGRLRFTAAAAPAPFRYRLRIPGDIHIRELDKQVSVTGAVESDSSRPCIRWQGEELVVRNRRPGDRYRTGGGSPARRLKKLFQKCRIPRSERDRLVILEGGGEILWVEGLPCPELPRAGAGIEHLWEIRVRDSVPE